MHKTAYGNGYRHCRAHLLIERVVVVVRVLVKGLRIRRCISPHTKIHIDKSAAHSDMHKTAYENTYRHASGGHSAHT